MTDKEMKARTDASNEKFEALRGTLVSWMDIHQARTEVTEEEIIARWMPIRKGWKPV
jgi:hypothetical protein